MNQRNCTRRHRCHTVCICVAMLEGKRLKHVQNLYGEAILWAFKVWSMPNNAATSTVSFLYGVYILAICIVSSSRVGGLMC